jgi:hypothetical protein
MNVKTLQVSAQPCWALIFLENKTTSSKPQSLLFPLAVMLIYSIIIIYDLGNYHARLLFSLQLRQTQRSIRQRYASSIKRHRLGVIVEEEDEEPQEDINKNEAVDALSEVVIENKPTVAKERKKDALGKSVNVEMQSPQEYGRLRSLDRNAANKLEVSCICNVAEIIYCVPNLQFQRFSSLYICFNFSKIVERFLLLTIQQ